MTLLGQRLLLLANNISLESVVPPKRRSGRFKATDKLIAWLEAATFLSTKKPSK